MKSFRKVLVVASSIMLLTASLYAAEKISLEGIKCVVNPKGAAKEGTGVDYKGGQVFFCCMNCPKAFKANTEKFATSANHQLVATKQTQQKACPLSGQPCKEDKALTIQGATIYFCCDNCKGAVAKLEGKEQIEKVFSDAAFKKAKITVKKDEK